MDESRALLAEVERLAGERDEWKRQAECDCVSEVFSSACCQKCGKVGTVTREEFVRIKCERLAGRVAARNKFISDLIATCEGVVERIAEVGEGPPWLSGTQLDPERVIVRARVALADVGGSE